MTPADITVVPMGADEHEAAFAAGKVDAVVTFEPVRTRLLHQGGKVVFDSRSIPDEIVDVLVVRDETRRSSPREIRSLEDGWYRALDYLQSKPDDACQRMARREGVSPGQLRMSLQGIKIPGREENERLVRGGLLPAARRLADLMLARRLLRAPVDPAALLASHGDVP
jgi:NitT/TauT family transport system substrate-binding protein